MPFPVPAMASSLNSISWWLWFPPGDRQVSLFSPGGTELNVTDHQPIQGRPI